MSQRRLRDKNKNQSVGRTTDGEEYGIFVGFKRVAKGVSPVIRPVGNPSFTEIAWLKDYLATHCSNQSQDIYEASLESTRQSLVAQRASVQEDASDEAEPVADNGPVNADEE